MKCPICGAPSDVLETRPYKQLFVRRSRECFNLHRFPTYEVAPEAVKQDVLKAIVNRVKEFKT